MTKVSITLTSANMGDVVERDYDDWAAFVERTVQADHPSARVTVEQRRFGDPAPDRVSVSGTDDDEGLQASILESLGHELWDGWCAEPASEVVS